MARFGAVAKLVSVSTEYDGNGAAVETRTERQVFANEFSFSTDSAIAARAQGLMLAAVLQVRSCDYGGEQMCEFNGRLLSVASSSSNGEMCTLTLGERLSDG